MYAVQDANNVVSHGMYALYRPIMVERFSAETPSERAVLSI